jgi:hypothetical protein
VGSDNLGLKGLKKATIFSAKILLPKYVLCNYLL